MSNQKTTILTLLLLPIVLLSGCRDSDAKMAKSVHQKTVPVSKEFQQEYSAAYEVDRISRGFTALPTTGPVKIERILRDTWAMEYPAPKYDLMLHYITDPPDYRYVYRTVALKNTKGKYFWLSEQQSFKGPKQYTTSDGTHNEQITITLEKIPATMNYQGKKIISFSYKCSISYHGPDIRLAKAGNFTENLTLDQIAPILREWKYSYISDQIIAASEGRIQMKDVPTEVREKFKRDYPSAMVTKITFKVKKDATWYSFQYIMDAEEMHQTSYCVDVKYGLLPKAGELKPIFRMLKIRKFRIYFHLRFPQYTISSILSNRKISF